MPSPATVCPTPPCPLEQLYLQRAQIQRLQNLLEQKTKLLQQRTALLDQKNADRALRSELDDAIDLLGVLAVEVRGRDLVLTTGLGVQLQVELERLREESEKSRMLAEQQQGQLDRLKDELGVTDEGISQLHSRPKRNSRRWWRTGSPSRRWCRRRWCGSVEAVPS